MNDLKELLEEARIAVGPGWWPIVEKYLTQMVALEPEAIIQTHEQYGTLHIRVYSKGLSAPAEIAQLERSVESASAKVCQNCGGPRKLRLERGWKGTLCDRCFMEE